MTIHELAEILHSAGVSAWGHPASQSADEWNEYRKQVAKEILDKCEVKTK